ncbi:MULTISPECIES: hypothetical protein [Bacteroides]|uniref:hypothetical protein n=1 Tax=Bacteroides TaxID=816 RepID=UPI0012936A65|nr:MULTISPECIES: hypothetical protein [Bacteroides]
MELFGSGKVFEEAQDYKWLSNYSVAVLEEVIEQDEVLNKLNPSLVNSVIQTPMLK